MNRFTAQGCNPRNTFLEGSNSREIAKNIGEQLLDLTKKVIEVIVTHINSINLASQGSMPRRDTRDPEQKGLEEQ